MDGPQEPSLPVGHNLRLRGGIYHFRTRVPSALHSILGQSEITVSLKTGRFASAVRAAREMRSGPDRIMVAVEQGASHTEIERQVRAWIARAALDYDARLANHDGLSGAFVQPDAAAMSPEQTVELDVLFRSIERVERDRVRALARATAAGLSPAHRADKLVAIAAEQMKLSVEPHSAQAKVLRRAILRYLPALMDAHDASDQGDPLPDRILAWLETAPVSPPATTPRPAPPAKCCGDPVTEL